MYSEVTFLKIVKKIRKSEGGGGRMHYPQALVNKCTYMATCFTVPRSA